jgi:hypothetical protein
MIYTYSGKMIDAKNVCESDITAEDISHALSQLCRASGQFKHFYSVAQHSVNCMKEAFARGFSRKVCFAALLHDGSEAYLSDISRPVKKYLPEYKKIEQQFQDAVYKRFGLYPLSEEEKRMVDMVDDAILWYEFKTISTIPLAFEKTPHLASVPDVSYKDMRTVEQLMKREIEAFENLKMTA